MKSFLEQLSTNSQKFDSKTKACRKIRIQNVLFVDSNVFLWTLSFKASKDTFRLIIILWITYITYFTFDLNQKNNTGSSKSMWVNAKIARKKIGFQMKLPSRKSSIRKDNRQSSSKTKINDINSTLKRKSESWGQSKWDLKIH